MKILMLTPYLPYPLLSGGQIRTYNLLKKLAQKHEITLFALIKEESEKKYIIELEKYCSKIKVFKRSQKPFTLKNIFKTAVSTYPFLVIRNHVKQVISEVEAELKNNKYDLIHAETFYMMPHIPQTQIPTILVEQTIEYLGYQSFAQKIKIPVLKQLLNLDIQKIIKWEKYYWRSCDKLIVMSQEDKKFISQKIGKANKIAVVSNGVDINWFTKKQKILPLAPTLLSVGTFKWLPNVEAVNFLVKQIWPLVKKEIKNAKLLIVGNAPTKQIFAYQQQDPDIKVAGNIPDIRDAFNTAHVLMAPVFSGKGTRYKILEAMASKTPIIATKIAVEGLGVKNNQHVLISNNAQGMANLAIKLLQDQALQNKLAKNGFKFVLKNFDWQKISKKLDSVYQEFA